MQRGPKGDTPKPCPLPRKLIMSDFDTQQVEEAIAKHKDVLLDQLENAVAEKLRSLTPKESLSLRVLFDTPKVIAPAASKEYGGALLAFLREKEYQGAKVDSAVTPVVLDVIESQIIAFYSSELVTEAIIDGIVSEVQSAADAGGAVRSGIQENMDWLRHEYSTLSVDTSYSMSGILIDTSVAQIKTFLASSTGKALIAGISKAMATTAGKIALKKILTVVVQKVMASAAIKTAIVAIIKKVGIAVLIKTAIGKAFIALLAVVGIAHVPAVWILLPLIVGFLAYEYFQFPEKLAKKLPKEIRAAVDEKFGELNEKISNAATKAIFDVLANEMTKARKG